MKRNCIYRYLTKNRVLKDILVYEEKDSQLYLLEHTGNSCYKTFSFRHGKKQEQITDNHLLDLIWVNSNIVDIEPRDSRINLQVVFGK